MGKRQGQRRKTCPIDGGATLSCHRHTDISTASATSGSYAARRFLDISSKNHSHRNALPHLTLTNTYPSRFITYDDNRAVFNDKLTSRNRTYMMFLQGFARAQRFPPRIPTRLLKPNNISFLFDLSRTYQ